MAQAGSDVPVEAAASLFGAGDEAAVDFFATSFNDDDSQEQSSRDPDVASNLFEAGPDESTTSFYQSVSYGSLLSNVNGVADSEANPQTTPDNQVESQTDYASQSQGWQDEYGQWHQYDSQTQYTSTYDYACMDIFISFRSV